jgi:hypothetical protein
MSEMLERADKWIADSGDDTEELQKAAAVITGLKEAYLKYFNMHHTLAVQEAGHSGILCDALGIEHYQRDLHELTLMVTARIAELENEIAGMKTKMPDLDAVINWLTNGCDPKHAVEELKIYQARINKTVEVEI